MRYLVMIHSIITTHSEMLLALLKRIASEEKVKLKIIDCKQERLNQEYYQEIMEYAPDLLITVDLAGFQIDTDTQDISYITMPCKSVHFIFRDDDFIFQKYLGKKLSIAMFFYCQGLDLYQKLIIEYPEIPYLRELPKLQDQKGDKKAEEYNYQVLKAVLKEIKQEAFLNTGNLENLT